MIEWIYNKLIKVFIITYFKVLLFICLLFIFWLSFLPVGLYVLKIFSLLLKHLPSNDSIDDEYGFLYGVLVIYMSGIAHFILVIFSSIFYYKTIINFYKGEKNLGFIFYMLFFIILNTFIKIIFFYITNSLNNLLSIIIALLSTILIYFYGNIEIMKGKTWHKN